MAEGVLAE
jgi:hypothetical protein